MNAFPVLDYLVHGNAACSLDRLFRPSREARVSSSSSVLTAMRITRSSISFISNNSAAINVFTLMVALTGFKMPDSGLRFLQLCISGRSFQNFQCLL